jgi:hypothetical protein
MVTPARRICQLLDALSGADGKYAARLLAGANVTMGHAAVEIDGIARPEWERRIKVGMKLHRAVEDVEIFFAAVADESAQLVDASRLDVDDDRDHHFPKQICGWIMMDVLL